MAFKFTELNVMLSTYYDKNDKNAPKADLNVKVKTCVAPSLAMQFGTCGTATQNPCNTKPDEMVLLSPLPGGNLAALQQQLQEMLASFGPAGTTVKKTPKPAAKKTASAAAKKAPKKPAKKTPAKKAAKRQAKKGT